MTWFQVLTGVDELSPAHVRKNIAVDGETMTSLANGKMMACGRLEIPSLGELRARVVAGKQVVGKISLREVIANVQTLHKDTANAGSLFQVASQFNLLEMQGPNVTPEHGIGIYERDHTQGPACAIAAGAGTIYRNYFVHVKGQLGQSEHNQIDCLADLGLALGNTHSRLWQMRNGYALASREGLIEIADLLRASGEAERDKLRKLLRIGIQWNPQVTLDGCTHLVSQAYCSALPVAYADHDSNIWEYFARLVVEAAYEATLCAAILNLQGSGNNRVFLTLLGGGAFGNENIWITDAIKRALKLYADWNLDIAVVSYRSSNPLIQEIVKQFS
jgi:hypothetical protein